MRSLKGYATNKQCYNLCTELLHTSTKWNSMLQGTHSMLPFSPFHEQVFVRLASCCLSNPDLCETHDIIVRQ